jgi:hypothetical protein
VKNPKFISWLIFTPSPLVGEGWGEGEKKKLLCSTAGGSQQQKDGLSALPLLVLRNVSTARKDKGFNCNVHLGT